MNQQGIDEQYMRRCLQLAVSGRELARPNPMVGAVICLPSASSDGAGRILGEGYHVCCGEGHAEVNAFASVKPEDERLLHAATLYVSLEPCAHYGKTPPCADLVVRKGVRRVVVGCIDDFAKVRGRGIEKIRAAGIEVTVGVLERECRWLNRRFFTYHAKHRPYVILKWAQTADGFLDDRGHPLQISTPQTKMFVHKLRAEEDAIVVGRTTWERECPQLNVRLWAGKSPERFVLSTRSSIPSLPEDYTLVDSIDTLFSICYERQLQSLIVEGGCETLQRFIDRAQWDEMRVETGGMAQQEGTRAPQIPSDLKPDIVKTIDGHTFSFIFSQSQRESLPIDWSPI